MKRVMTVIIIAALMLCLAGVASAYTILDNETGGDCTQIGTWDAGTKTCTLTGDLTEGLIIDSDYLTVDGSGHSMTGTVSSTGVYLNARTGCTIKNLSAFQFGIGIYLSSSNDNLVMDNNFSNNACSTYSTCGGYTFGIYLSSSSSNMITGNTVMNHPHTGIALAYASYNNMLAANTSLHNLESAITLIAGASGNILENNTASYSGHGILLRDNCNGNAISNNTASNNVYYPNQGTANIGIFIDSSSDNTVTDNTAFDNVSGIAVTCWDRGAAYNNQIYNNNADSLQNPPAYCSPGTVFNLPLPIGGNYSRAFDEPTEGCSDSNNDGICDEPYGNDGLPWVMQSGWLVDGDSDGFARRDDCNDSNPAINPAASEIPYNGIDENCNGMADDDDLDHDNYGIAVDCNDNSASVYPGAAEIKHDGIDQDCNGYDMTIDITKAIYTTRKDRLRVEATSALGASANLQLVGYGAMTWDGISKWIKTVEPAGGNPGTVTVSGIEGAESAPTTVQ